MSGLIVGLVALPLGMAAQRATAALMRSLRQNVKIIVFDFEMVPLMDMTGLVAFESALKDLRSQKKRVILTGLREQPLAILMGSPHVTSEKKNLLIINSFSEAIKTAKRILNE